MNISVSQSQLVKTLQAASILAKSNTQVPILANILLENISDQVMVRATDLNSGISISLEMLGALEPKSEQKVVLPSAQLLEYIQALSPGEVSLDINQETVNIKQGNSTATFPLTSADDYPNFLPQNYDSGIQLKTEDLVDCVRKASIAVADDDSRPLLTGLLFKQKADSSTLQVVGTDGYRLSIAEVNFSGEWEKDIVIPAKPLATLLKNWEGESIALGFDGKNNQAWFKSERRVGVVRVLLGDFPDFNRILPTTSITQVEIPREEFMQAVAQLSVFAKQNANIIQMEVGASVRLSTQSSYVGSGTAELEAVISGDPLSIAFNYRYLRDYLLAVSDGNVTLIFNGPLAPVKFLTNAQPNLLHIIMPVKL